MGSWEALPTLSFTGQKKTKRSRRVSSLVFYKLFLKPSLFKENKMLLV